MPKEESDSRDIDTFVQQLHGEGVPEAVEGDVLVDAGRLYQKWKCTACSGNKCTTLEQLGQLATNFKSNGQDVFNRMLTFYLNILRYWIDI